MRSCGFFFARVRALVLALSQPRGVAMAGWCIFYFGVNLLSFRSSPHFVKLNNHNARTHARPPARPRTRLSERVINVLGGNPGPYTLNGTNCFIVGTGKRRLLIDTGEPEMGAEQQMSSMRQAMREHGIVGFDMILVTHMHGDHFGGVQRILEAFPGPTVVAMLAGTPMSLSLNTMANLRSRGLIPILERGQLCYCGRVGVHAGGRVHGAERMYEVKVQCSNKCLWCC